MEHCFFSEKDINLSIGSNESRKMEKKETMRHGVVIDPSLGVAGALLFPEKAERMRAFWAERGAAALARLR
jgi:hypothetical protein